jgi:protein involved in polysaccharide export with SLBB domain
VPALLVYSYGTAIALYLKKRKIPGAKNLQSECRNKRKYSQMEIKKTGLLAVLSAVLALSVPVFIRAADSTHLYQKGDAVRIAVSSDTTHFVNGTYHIDDNGFVFLPVLGKVKIDSMTEKSFVSLLNSSYLSFLRYPTIQVHLLMRVSLLGGFAKPGLFYVDPSASLWDAIALAGGPVREDGLKKINWEREGQIIDKNLLPSIESGKSLSTLGMRSGDQLWITHVPKKDGWEIFSSEYLPVISVAVSALSTTATLFVVYQTYRK